MAVGILSDTPIVSLAVIRRLVLDEKTDELEVEGEHPALVWDPTAVRAILDETLAPDASAGEPGPHLIVATLAPAASAGVLAPEKAEAPA
jgi:hypothetical protein